MNTTTTQSWLYVATDLDTWETSSPEPDQDQICERCGYRRLDPTYYAWLRRRMEVAKQARERGRLAAAQYQDLRGRFNAVHFWATVHLGEAVLLAAVRALDPKAYQPPQVEEWQPESQPEPARSTRHLFPADGDWHFTENVSPEAVAQVDAIRDQALSLGWTEATLYQNRGHLCFPTGDTYGLVCFLHGGSVIGEVTARFIEIISSGGSRLRHYNREVQQPWIRRDQSEGMSAVSDISRGLPVCNRQESM